MMAFALVVLGILIGGGAVVVYLVYLFWPR